MVELLVEINEKRLKLLLKEVEQRASEYLALVKHAGSPNRYHPVMVAERRLDSTLERIRDILDPQTHLTSLIEDPKKKDY